MKKTIRILKGLLVGVFVGSLPWIVTAAGLDIDLVSFILTIISIPGIIVALLTSRGNSMKQILTSFLE
jgi:hypothetical protein